MFVDMWFDGTKQKCDKDTWKRDNYGIKKSVTEKNNGVRRMSRREMVLSQRGKSGCDLTLRLPD